MTSRVYVAVLYLPQWRSTLKNFHQSLPASFMCKFFDMFPLSQNSAKRIILNFLIRISILNHSQGYLCQKTDYSMSVKKQFGQKRDKHYFLFSINFLCICLAVSGLNCGMQGLSLGCMDSWVVAGRLSSCDLGSGTCGLQYWQHMGSLAMARRLQSTQAQKLQCRLSCSTTCGILVPQPGTKPASSTL